MPERLLSADSLGGWLLKADPTAPGFADLAAAGFSTVRTRCVRASYRTALVAPGQPVLLWVSGCDPSRPAGIHARGRTTGEVRVERDELVVPVSLSLLSRPVPRTALLTDPVLRELEVLRMPAGSNPSYLTREQWASLCAGWPQVGGGPDRGAHGRRSAG